MKIQQRGIRRLSFAIPMAVALTLVATACAGTEGGSQSGEEQKTITVITSNDAPFSMDDGDGGLTGIDGDMITAIAETNGWKIKVFVTDFNTMIPALQSNKGDVIVDAMYITDERAKEINFTDTWYIQGEGMLVPGDSDLKSRDDVKGKVLGAQTGTVFAEFIESLGGSDTKFFDSQAAIIQAVENGQVDAAFTDSAVVAYSLVQNPNDKVKLVTPYEPHFPGKIGAGIKKDNPELLEDINTGLAELKESPDYLEILKKYGLGEDNVAE
ncbi:substrate-binding periplasmic protein [Glaciibacter superstes]|uniref:substrate-binding periplasmic protein n=1 Tax=Glaciibacter superstes TaxID=501023 RepID=UPI0003B35914|nr:transporter substrate-binding domain-containing protein [Glaciibacter superstes]